MGRINKFTAGVFTNIVGTDKEPPAFNHFISIQDLLKKPSKELNSFLKSYKTNVTTNKDTIEMLAKLEDLIMQLRTKENLTNKDIKLNVVREYIYARVPFHRKDKGTKDMRVIVGQTQEWGTDIKKLLGNAEFMDNAKLKLITAMDEMIRDNKEQLKTFQL